MNWQLLADSYGLAFLTMLVYVVSWFVISLIYKRNDVADVAWGLGFVVVTAALMFKLEQTSTVSYIVTLLVLVWGLRLSSHIWNRVRKHSEDERYAKWRREWKYVKLRSFFQVFLLQGILMLGVISPVVVIMSFAPSWNWLATIGVVIWLFGFSFESIGDAQLAEFIANPTNKGKLMQTGLWKYTRHPNYFGEVTQWWGIGIIALSAPLGWIGLIGPALITYLIVFVSGVPLLEQAMQQRPGFAEYAKRTSMLIPWPPKSTSL